VTSARLPAQARVQNRMFPKTRSWLALGAPLELLSPLSVLRIIYALAMVLWAVEGLALRWPHAAVLWHLGATIVAAAVWVALLLVKDLTPLACRLLIALGSLLALMQVYLGHSIGPVLASALFLLPLAMFVALYLGGRAIVVYQLLVAGGLWLALAGNLGKGSTTVVVVAGGLAMLSASLTVHVLTRSVSRSGSVDPDTGLPNGIGWRNGSPPGAPPAGAPPASSWRPCTWREWTMLDRRSATASGRSCSAARWRTSVRSSRRPRRSRGSRATSSS
jgi:hypothetical protein